MQLFFSKYLLPANLIALGILIALLYFFSEYLLPANLIALWILIALFVVFIFWLFFFRAGCRLLSSERSEIEKSQGIQPLVTDRQKRDLRQKDNKDETDPNPIFRDFCKERSLDPNSFISKHLKSIFLAGWNESRLEVTELINHTASNLFRWNSLLRSLLAIFIVIGLLGTLFGLTDSLVELSSELKPSAEAQTSTENDQTDAPAGANIENSRQMTEALSDLMDDIKGAFAPSIAGVFFTIWGVILYGFFTRFVCYPVKSTLEQSTLTVWVPKLYPTTSQKLIQTLQESETQMRSGYETALRVDGLVENIQTNVDEFNKSLTQANAITEPLAESGTKINKAASAISTAAGELNQGFTKSLNDFADVLNKGFLQSLSKFSKEFTSSVSQLTGFQEEIRKLHQEFQQAANEKLDQHTEKLDQQNQNFVQASNVLDQVLRSLKDYEAAYIDSRQQIDETLQEFIEKATETNTSIYKENREWFEKIDETNRQQFTEMSKALKNQLDDLTGGLVEKLENVQQGLDSGLTKLNEQLENFDTPLKQTVEGVKGVFDNRLETLNERLEKFNEPLQESAENMRNTYADSVTYMQGIFGHLQLEMREQNEKYEEQLTGVKSLNKSVKGLLTQLDMSSKNQKDAVHTLSTNVGELQTDIQSLDAAIKSFTSDSGNISQSVGAIKEHVETLGNASRELIQKADVTPLNANIKGMSEIIGEISQNSQNLAYAVNQLTKQIDLSRTSESERNRKKRSLLSKLNLFSRRKTDGR